SCEDAREHYRPRVPTTQAHGEPERRVGGDGRKNDRSGDQIRLVFECRRDANGGYAGVQHAGNPGAHDERTDGEASLAQLATSDESEGEAGSAERNSERND